jgi:hypothetical protein
MATFESFKDRPEPSAGVRVRVYRNLLRPSYFSIMAMTGECKNLVLGHARAVHLQNVRLITSEVTRAKVIKNKSRVVHAYADGFYQRASDTLPQDFSLDGTRQVTYQPFVRQHFFDRDEPEAPVSALAECCMFGANCLVPPHAAITCTLNK